MAPLYFAALALIIIYIFTNRILHKIRNLPPTPFPTLPIIGHLYLLSKPLHRALARISAHHGPITFLRFGSRPVLLVTSPSAANECFTKNDVAFANRPDLMAGKILGYNFTSLTWTPYGDNWRILRRICTVEILSAHRLQLLSSVRIDEVKRLICRLDRGSRCGETVNMKTIFFELMLNVLTRMIAGKRYCGEEDQAAEAERFREMVEETFRVSEASNPVDFLPVLRWIGVRGMEKKLTDLQERKELWLQEMFDEHRRPAGGTESEEENIGGRKKTMIELLLSLKETEPEFYSDQKIRSIIWVLLAAGTDTSSGTMEWVLSILLNHPKAMKKVQDEIDQNVGSNRLVEESDLAHLPYLHCVIKETMRMVPVGPLLLPHQSSVDCSVGGYRVPRGTMLLVNVRTIQNDASIWENPNEFRPERFEGGVEVSRDEFKMFPFGVGRRQCPGEGLATRMIGLTIGSLIQCFDWEGAGKEMDVDMREGHGLTMHKAYPLMVKCKSRPIIISVLPN